LQRCGLFSFLGAFAMPRFQGSTFGRRFFETSQDRKTLAGSQDSALPQAQDRV